MSDDDWRGEHRLRIPKRSGHEINRETNSISQRLAHAKRRAAGCGQARSGGLWARQIKSWTIAASIKGGME